jgi:putative transposase
VLLDSYSRYVVGWMVAARKAASLAERLLAEAITAQGVEAGQLAVHADRGSSMTSKPVALLLADLGVVKSHSRPHVPDDNPYSEAQFKTLKHHPTFPTGSARSPTPAPSARASSAGTTPSTATAGSRCSPPPTSTTAAPSRSPAPEPPSWTEPSPPTQNGSSASHPRRRCRPRPYGSTSPSTLRRHLSNFPADVSHRG